MPTLRQAAQQALDALEASNAFVEASSNAKLLHGWGEQLDLIERTASVLRQALEVEQQSEPVATVAEVHMSRYTLEWTNEPLPEGTLLYTHPQPTPQPLTEELLHSLWLYTPVDYYTDNESIFKQAARAIEHSHNIK